LHPGWMGDIDEEDLVSNGTGLGVSCHGLPYDFVPRSQDGISLQWDIDLQSLQGFLKNGMDGLGFLHQRQNFRFQIADFGF
jgi:hypothetical protein